MRTTDPLATLPAAPSFTVTSATLRPDGSWPAAQLSGVFGLPGGQDLSPQLSWSGAPAGTRSFAVTVHDPDAPTPSGFWHWAVVDLPASTTGLPEGVGRDGGAPLPDGATQLRNDAGTAGYLGAAPPAGDGPHRYVVVVSALDTDRLPVGPDATPAMASFVLAGHVLARGVLVATAEAAPARPADHAAAPVAG